MFMDNIQKAEWYGEVEFYVYDWYKHVILIKMLGSIFVADFD